MRQDQYSDVSEETDGNTDDDVEMTGNQNNTDGADIIHEPFGPVQGRQKSFPFTQKENINEALIALLTNGSPFDFFSVFIDEKIWSNIADETNLYATQCLTKESSDTSKHSRKHSWVPTTKEEIKKLFGLLAYMGIIRMPSMRDYWSRDNFYHNKVCSSTMSRNRFELLLSMLHFSNNENLGSDRLCKIQSLIDAFIANSQAAVTPPETFCIDESLIPFRGRVILRQYMPQKAHKYGIKVFKLCCNDGYTWNMKVYSGKEADGRTSVPTKVVMDLSEKLLNQGRTVVTDNFYTSLELADKLLKKNTHLLGTLRKNRKGNPKKVIEKKLKKGEMTAKENEDGVTILKWKDKRDVLMLSTKHTDEMVTITKNGKEVLKPKMVIDYNKGKTSIDISDQFSSYASALRKTIKWYKKVAIEIILGTAIVNSYFCYQNVTGNSISITKFRESVVKSLLAADDYNISQPSILHFNRMQSHSFKKMPGSAREGRKYCKGCYKKKSDGLIPRSKIRKVTTFCDDCDNKPRYCLECFNAVHNN